MTRNSPELPARAQAAAQQALEYMREWQRDNPRVADYRATDSIHHLGRAITALGHLHGNTHSSTYTAALTKARRALR
ncbi:hypothetical protein [Streptomyces abikoensis]